jgi:integral membrane protein
MYLCISNTRVYKMKNIFRIISFLEGVSYLLLLFIASPIKYLQGDASYVKMLGMPHGILFMLYVVMAIVIKKEMNWNNKTLGLILVASIIPFGTFYVDKKYLR